MPERIKVIDKQSGVESSVPVDDYDPIDHEIVKGQVATVAPLGGDEFAAGQEVTERSLSGDALLEQFSPGARAELTAEQVEESTFDTTANIAEQAGRGVASGLSFGLSELALRDADPFERERERRQRSAAPGAFAIGEAAGGIGGVVLSGGTGVAGTFARLTPQGRLAALGAKFASGGQSAASKFARQVGAGAFEGAVENVGATLARQALSEHPDFSAEALLSAAGKGAGVGGGITGIFAGAGLIKGRIGARRAARAEATAAEKLAAAADAATAAKQVDIPISDVVSRKGRTDAPEAFSGLVGQIDDATKIVKKGAVDTLAGESQVVLSAAERNALRVVEEELEEAANRARKWAEDYSGELGIDDLTRATREDLSKPVRDELDDEAAVALGALDDKLTAYNRLMAETRTKHGVATKADTTLLRKTQAQAAPAATEAAAPASKGVSAFDKATSALGVAEIASDLGHDLGLPSVKDIPVVGDALSTWVKFKAGMKALGGRGVRVPKTETTGAAARVNGVRNRIGGVVARVATGAKVAFTSKAAARGVRKAAAIALREVLSADPAAVQEQVANATRGAPEPVRQAAMASANRTMDYLKQTAPVNPLNGTPWAESWEPSEIDATEWDRRYRAATHPEQAIIEILTNPGALVEAETVRVTAPGLWTQTRSDLMTRIDDLAKNLPQNHALAIGRAFDVPLHQSMSPGYARFDSVEPAPPPQPGGSSGRPLSGPGPNVSPIAQGDAVAR